jgi:hypothetical protein
MSDEGKPPASVTTDLRVAHLTKAVTHKRQIRFELHVPENDSAPELAEALRQGFFIRGMPYVPGFDGPISVDEHERDPSRITVVYKPHGKRDLAADMRALVAIFEEMEIPITDKVEEGMQAAFDALRAANAQEHGGAVAAEAERRRSGKGPGGRGPR